MMVEKDYSNSLHRITIGIQQLNQHVLTLNQLVERGGASGDDEARNSAKDYIQKSNVLSKSVNTMIKDLLFISRDDRNFRVQRERIMNDYMTVLNKLQALQRKAILNEKAHLKAVAADDEALSSEARGQSMVEDSFRLKQIQQQHNINLNEIRERQEALTELERDIGDINQIFKDLAHIIHDQGEMVDSIEANIEHTSIRVGQANSSLNQALQYQKQARQKKFMLSIFCIALLLIILLVLYLWIR